MIEVDPVIGHVPANGFARVGFRGPDERDPAGLGQRLERRAGGEIASVVGPFDLDGFLELVMDTRRSSPISTTSLGRIWMANVVAPCCFWDSNAARLNIEPAL